MEQPRKVSEKKLQHLNEVVTLIYKSAIDTKELKNASRKFSQSIECFNTAFIMRFENEKGPRRIMSPMIFLANFTRCIPRKSL